MKHSIILLIAASLAVFSCKNNETAVQNDETLSLENLFWVNEPKIFSMNGGDVVITTEGKTDLWQHIGGADLSNAPILVTKAGRQNFTFTVKTDFSDASRMYDQCGPIVYIDRDNWLKASVENAGEEGYLGSVNNMDGRSDWATSNIDGSIKTVWYKVVRSGCDFIVSSSFDGEHYNKLRVTHVNKAEGEVCVGVYACSPGDGASFNAKFSEMDLTPGGGF